MDILKSLGALTLVTLLALGGIACFGDDDPADPDEDTTPPAAVDDLVVLENETTLNNVTLNWTAPGDDGDAGTATTYDLRYTARAHGRFDWESATPVTGEPSPGPAGTLESFTVTGLDPVTEYSFALKTADEVPNTSALSNTAVDTTLGGLISTNAQAGWYSIVDEETGEDLAHVHAAALQLCGETSLGFQARNLFILSPTGSGGANTAIYRCDPFTGEGLTTITDDDALDVRQLDGSPVAPVIAFSASDTENYWENIYTVSESGGAVTQLTFRDQVFTLDDGPSVQILGASQPHWSPEGSRIAFLCQSHEVGIGGNRFDAVCVMDADGGNLSSLYWRNLETAHYDTPCWTADGGYVAFMEGNSENEGVMFVSLATGLAYNLWDDLDVTDWPPDMLTTDPWRMRLCVYYNFPSGSDIWIAELNTSGDAISAAAPVKLTDQFDTGHAYGRPDWAPWAPEF